MGKFNFGVDSTTAVGEELGEGFYSGPTPPGKKNYTCLVKQFKIKKNRNDDFRLSVLLEIQEEEDSENAIYNGYGFWGGYNVTDQSRPWINNLLDGIGVKRKDFWDEKITTSPGKIDKDTAQDVLKIGARKTTGHMVRVATKFKPADGQYDEGLEPTRFLTDEEVPQRAASDVEPDSEAQGLDEAADTGEDATGGYSEEELSELEPEDLRAICKDWEIKHAPKATKATLIKLILAAQDEDTAEEESEEAESEDTAEEEAEDTADGDALTEEDLEAMSKEELLEYMTEQGWEEKIPKPAIPSRLRKLILQFQSEPPF